MSRQDTHIQRALSIAQGFHQTNSSTHDLDRWDSYSDAGGLGKRMIPGLIINLVLGL